MKPIRQIGTTAVRVAALSLVLSAATLVCTSPAQAWTLNILYKFTGGSDGFEPNGDLVRDPATGNLYGTTIFGGANGVGTIFKVTPKGKETVLYNFIDSVGSNPDAGLVRDSAGNLYGTACCGGQGGIAFKLSTKGVFTVLHAFNNEDGVGPGSRLLRDDVTGDLYGTTTYGGASNCGTVFRLSADRKYKVLYSFAGGDDGCDPRHSGVVMDSAGNLYGSTWEMGGSFSRGMVYKLAADGTETILHRFSGPDGEGPQFGPVIDGVGNLIGATPQGGAHNAGVAFKLAPDGTYTVLHNFEMDMPWGPLLLQASGSVYGVTQCGCQNNHGVLYHLKRNGTEKTLYSLPGTINFPRGGLIADEQGKLYGAAEGFYPYGDYGTVFELVKD